VLISFGEGTRKEGGGEARGNGGGEGVRRTEGDKVEGRGNSSCVKDG